MREHGISCRKKFFLPVRVLSRLYRRFFVELLMKAFNQDRLKFYGKISHLSNPESFAQLIKKCFNTEWVVYAEPFTFAVSYHKATNHAQVFLWDFYLVEELLIHYLQSVVQRNILPLPHHKL